MKKKLGIILTSLCSFPTFADCGYGTVSNIRMDDARGAFRITLESISTSKNGCSTSNQTLIINEDNSQFIDNSMALSLALTALTTGKPIWVDYDSSSKYLNKINLYTEL